MDKLTNYIQSIDNQEHKLIIETLCKWIKEHYPQLSTDVKWSQATFINEGTFILAIKASKHHYSIFPEEKCVTQFESIIKENSLSHTSNLIRFDWNQPINYELIKLLIEFNIEDKMGSQKYWR